MSNENETVDLEQIRVDLVAWRGRRRRGERISSEMWERVAAAVAKHGLKRVRRTLGLAYDRLKREVGGDPASPRGERPVFVEVGGARTPEGLSCVVELEKGKGTRRRIQAREGIAWIGARSRKPFLGRGRSSKGA